MGVISGARILIDRIFWGERPEDVVEETTEDPFLARSLQIDEDMRTGRSRTLSVEETRRELDRIKREGWNLSEARRRQRSRKAPGRPQEPTPTEPELQDLIIENQVLKFLENSVQAKLRKSAVERLEALRNPQNRRGSIKIRGRPNPNNS